MVVLLQTSFHAVEAVELDEACAHELLGPFVCAQADFGWVELFEVRGDGLFGCRIREVALFYG